MSSFKMRTRPKKPTQPQTITFEVGSCVTLEYLLEHVEKFKAENPDRSPKEIMLEIEETDWHDRRANILLSVPPQSQKSYEAKVEAYKLDVKAYKSWQKGHEKEIDLWKVAEKKKAAKRKLKWTQKRLNKELAAVEVKLGKA